MHAPRFVSFEGGEGSGKTTQIKRLAGAFEKEGRRVLLTREPGGSPSAESLRRLLVEGAPEAWDAVSETLLFLAARRNHWQTVIAPALKQGMTVLCDRFSDSTLVYQGLAKGLSLEYVQALSRLTLPVRAVPDITLLLDIAPAEGLSRARARMGRETRFEAMDMAFHMRVREGFLRLAGQEPGRIRIIDAAKSIDEVFTAVKASC